MKNKKSILLISILLSSSLVSCKGISKIITKTSVSSVTSSISKGGSSSSGVSNSTSSKGSTTSVISTTSKTTTSQTSKTSTTSTTSIASVTSTKPSATSYVGTRKLSMYGINDFHGSVIPTGMEYGIESVASFLKEKKDEGNTLLFNSGDFWQGAIESNYNRGELLSKVSNAIEFDCFTLGNHDFDWGSAYIEKNRALKDEETNYQTPYLAANIYHYNPTTGTTGTQASNLGQEYVIKELENGLRVGIIGTIATKQWTSITSSYVNQYIFVNPTPIIKELSDKLRLEENCDVVVLSSHADVAATIGSTSSDSEGLTEVSGKTNKRYIDACFCAHSHSEESFTINGVPFIQASSNGKDYGYINLSVTDQGEVSVTSQGYSNSITSSSTYSKVSSLVSTYKAVTDEASSEVLGTVSGTFTSSANIPNLVCKAIADYAEEVGKTIDFSMCNSARSYLYSGSITYGNLYKSLPFDNVVYIITASGKDIMAEAKYNSIYRVNENAVSSSSYYTIAVIDYLALHKNESRNYDYFPSASVISYLTKSGYDIYNYRDITADYIRKVGTISSSDFGSTGKFNKTLTSAVES